MVSHFSAEFFVGNRRRLRELFTGTAPIVLTANGLLQRGADAAFPFHQDASFWYFTGSDEPDVVLVMDKDNEYIIVPPRDARRVAFEGAVDHASLKNASGVAQVLDEQEGWRKLEARLARAKHVATIPAPSSYIAAAGIYTNPARRRLISRMKACNEQLQLLDITEHVTRLRAVKQPEEVTATQVAIDITVRALRRVLRPARMLRYAHEYEVEAELSREFRRQGVRVHAFDPIFASGAHACTLHYELNNSPLVAGELLLCDVGAEYDHYAADLTRTVSIGSPTRRQEQVYVAVLEVHTFALTLLKPGLLLKEYEQQVRAFMGEKLRELGLIKVIEPDALRRYYPHSTSHFLGLNVHDVGLYDQPLEAGMLLTVEPGIYIAEEAIGIRVEDDVLITNSGNRVLSSALPRTLS